MEIVVGARESALSKTQVEEVMRELEGVKYHSIWIKTTGDKDLKSSLIAMDKTDFFTREIDTLLLKGKIDIGIHSAKDLPDPLPEGLTIVALTQGVDSGDSLVLREGERFETLKKGSIIGSSSVRRERVIKGLRPDLTCIEIRGTIEKRLEQLDIGKVDGVVVANAALIRLGLLNRNRIDLPGETAPLQGKLAVVAREGDLRMQALFSQIDTRIKSQVLYLGLNPKHYGKEVFHCPLIEIVPRDFSLPEIRRTFEDIPNYSHFIFTSKNSVAVFCDCLKAYGYSSRHLKGKKFYAIGRVTASYLAQQGMDVDRIATEETQEGMIHLLAIEDLDDAYFCLPQSSRARSALIQALILRGVRHQLCSLYDTQMKLPSVPLDLEVFDEVVFTSPSTVEAFKKIFGRKIPKKIKLTAIGSITQQILKLEL